MTILKATQLHESVFVFLYHEQTNSLMQFSVFYKSVYVLKARLISQFSFHAIIPMRHLL